MAPSQAPQYLTGNTAAIDEFLDKFDVRHFHGDESKFHAHLELLIHSLTGTQD